MKKRILSLLLAVALLVGISSIPASAAAPKDVFAYLKAKAMSGTHNTSAKTYTTVIYLDDDRQVSWKAVYYESSGRVDVQLSEPNLTVVMELKSSMSTPFTAYINYPNVGKGTTQVYPSSYTGQVLSFSAYSGNTAKKAELQATFNQLLPELIEFTGTVIWGGNYRLKDMGFTKFTRHVYHLYDSGVVKQKQTCTQKEIRLFTCVVCGSTKTETKPPLGHNWSKSWISVQPTCAETGTRVYQCGRCGAQKTETVPVTDDHHWVVTEILTPSAEDEHGTAKYACSVCRKEKEAELCACEIFTDAPKPGNWAHAAIDWAVFSGVTSGALPNRFMPESTCTRAQVVTFLWRASGCPEPESLENPFTDVAEDDYFYRAVLWAVENGVTYGVSATSFGPLQACTRAQVVTFLWRAKGGAAAADSENPFTDVEPDDWFYDAVLWAVGNEITMGTSETTFSPAVTCSRVQVVTFLYRARNYHAPDPEPIDPPEPTDPTDPIEPTDPTDPTGPVEPTDSTDPTDPTEPIDPTDPTDPTEPIDPTDPTNPTDPPI